MKTNKYILLLIVASLGIATVSFQLTNHAQKKVELLPAEDYVYDIVDEMPQFPGGKIGLEKYIKDNLVYPKKQKKAGIKGRVYTEFIVEQDGELTNEKVYEGISRKLEFEALKVVKNMPHWIPGRHKDKRVRVKIVLPITFK